jgi:hypothetical protein
VIFSLSLRRASLYEGAPGCFSLAAPAVDLPQDRKKFAP